MWRAWSALGVAGQGRDAFRELADPEALLVFTLSMARYDARLFDAVLEWLGANGRFVSPQRLRLLMRRSGFRGQVAVGAAAAWLDGTSPSWRWRLSATRGTVTSSPEPLFLTKNGRALPVVGNVDAVFLSHGLLRSPFVQRGVALSFPAEAPSCLWLRLRALFGVSARADVLAYLLTCTSGHAREIARRTGYAQRTVLDVLSDMERSGYTDSIVQGRIRTMRVNAALRGGLLEYGPPQWKPWPEILEMLETLWWNIEEWCELGLSGIGLDSEILLTARPMAEQLARAGLADAIELQHQKGFELLAGMFRLIDAQSVPQHNARKAR